MPVRRTLLALLLCASAGWAAELKTLKQETFTGDLVGISDKEVVIHTANGDVKTPIDQVLTLTFGAQPGAMPNVPWVDVELTDGTELHCAKFSVVKKDVTVTMLAGQTVKFPLASLGSMLGNAHLEKTRKDWADVVEKTSRSKDVLARIATIKDDKTGMEQQVPNAAEGLIGEASEDGSTIRFTLASGKEGDIPFTTIYGMIFSRKPDPSAAPVICRLTDTHRNLVMVSSAEGTPTGFTVTTPAGAKIEYTPTLVLSMDYSRGKRDYLSAMTPTKVEEKVAAAANAESDLHFRTDRSLYDGPLELNNTTYDKGLALHAHSELVYDLNGAYREFHAVVGLDREGQFGRTVLVRIEADGVEVAKLTFTRGDKDKSAPVVVTRNIKDAKKLHVIVTHLDVDKDNDIGLNAVLADAYVSK
jgi:hypothetical protein